MFKRQKTIWQCLNLFKIKKKENKKKFPLTWKRIAPQNLHYTFANGEILTSFPQKLGKLSINECPLLVFLYYISINQGKK